MLDKVQVFVTKWFARFARREGISHQSLLEAIERAERGLRSQMKAKKLSRPLAEALLETAEGRHRVGILDDEAYRKITLLHLGTEPQPAVDPVTSKEIRRMREKANLSQAAFARYLNLTPGYISQLERGIKEPKGPALALLQRDSAEGD